MREIKYLFLHCTATKQSITSEQINNIWKSRGWKIGGYHYIIYPNGHIENAIAIEKVSNGVKGYNAHAINIAWVGGVDDRGRAIDNRTEVQKIGLVALVKLLHKHYPTAVIMGHRDIWGKKPQMWRKMCPCFDVQGEICTKIRS